jgi:hypothetical protein
VLRLVCARNIRPLPNCDCWDTDVTEKLLKGYKVGDTTYKVHLDGFNLVPYLSGQVAKSPRQWFLYCNDDQQLVGLRYDNVHGAAAARHVASLSNPSSPFAFQRFLISAPIRSSAPT